MTAGHLGTDYRSVRPAARQHSQHCGGKAGCRLGHNIVRARHATTKACLVLLESLALAGQRGALLDAGCGSGIQSIAAAKLGFAPIDAFDN
jgi:2-polyprenyl-3-methyl-5-hydroxy-6-metoxy-1,4-benzoquinol methylase